jgi:hypothetical protein
MHYLNIFFLFIHVPDGKLLNQYSNGKWGIDRLAIPFLKQKVVKNKSAGNQAKRD